MSSSQSASFRGDPMWEKTALVAELYYIYKLPQKKIAQQLGISRPWVSKLLKRAEETGIVTIKVETAYAGIDRLQDLLIERFGLEGAKVIPTSATAGVTLKDCARAASHLLVSMLEPGDVLALSWGYTLAALAEEFALADLSKVTLVPLVGGMGENTRILSNHIVDRIASRSGANYHLLHLPAFVAGREQKESLLADPLIQGIIALGERPQVVMCSLGSLRHSTMVQDGYLSPTELSELEALGAVGDIALQFIDGEGRLVDHPVRHRLVSGDFVQTRKNARTSVALALGERKVEVIRAALVGGWLDVLVTDEVTAERLLV